MKLKDKLLWLGILLFGFIPVYAFELVQEFDGVRFYKWKEVGTGRLFFTDQERDDYLSLAPSTNTLSDFENIALTPTEIAVATTTLGVPLETLGVTISEVTRILIDKAYLEQLIVAEALRLEQYDSVKKRSGLDLHKNKSKEKSESKLEFLKRQYQTLP